MKFGALLLDRFSAKFKIPSAMSRGSPQNFTRHFCGRLHRPRHKLSWRLRTDRLGLEF
ncbi:hypothetical protein CAMGR0001_2063 [Campylobacter gracilis RM3268]|uniref:Uncharacterized protein n=1 Tax=Campylobacter gracilis RM3268 TaxID=553220 RepID=C8PLQ4_9BACT|nr:hypothetical protein CAMGR0001_2063 [Campylobacter gracilis RM3268]